MIGNAVIVLRKPLAGRTATVTLRVRRSHNGAALKSGKMTCDLSVAGKRIRHGDSFKNGTARLSFRLPNTAKGKVVRIKVTITFDGRSATRTATFRIG